MNSCYYDYQYEQTLFNQTEDQVQMLVRFNTLLCTVIVIASICLKKRRAAIGYLAALYMGNILIYSMNYVYGRYNASLMPIRYILLGIGLGLLAEYLTKQIQALEKVDK